MLRSRLLISVLVIAFAVGLALLKPLAGRADDGDAPPTEPTPPTSTTPVIPALPVFKRKAKRTRSTQSHLAFGRRVVDYAERFRGIRYVYGGSSPRSGFDCSGFVMYVFSKIGVSLPHSSYAQFGMGTPVSIGQLQPGDLVFFSGASHVGIYIGGGQFIHAPHTGDVVKISSLSGYYSSAFAGGRRI